MHGGAAGSAAPRGNQNALKHGLDTRESKELLAPIRELSRQTKDLIEKI
jgi:uncharacterized protein YjcR